MKRSLIPLMLLCCSMIYGQYYVNHPSKALEKLDFFEETEIFTCTILETYQVRDRYRYLAKVEHSFTGNATGSIEILSQGKLLEDGLYIVITQRAENGEYRSIGLSEFLIDHSNKTFLIKKEKEIKLAKLLLEYLDLRDNKYTGFKQFYLDDSLILEGKLKNGLKEELWKFYDKDSKLPAVARTYKKDKWNGRSTRLYFNQKELYSKSIFVYDDFHVIYRQHFTSDVKPYTEEIFEFQKEEGIYRHSRDLKFNSDGDTVQIINFFVLTDTLDLSIHTRTNHGYYKNLENCCGGRAEGNYFFGARVGDWAILDENSDTIRVEKYVLPPLEENRFISFEDNGAIKISGAWQNGKRHGVWSVLNNGKLKKEVNYNNGLLHGVVIDNKKDGRKWLKTYRNGKLDGLMSRIGKDARLKYEATYLKNKKEGIETRISYYEDGKIRKSVSTFRDGRKNGEELKYEINELGDEQLIGKYHYLDDYLHGPYMKYKNGEIVLKVEYEKSFQTKIERFKAGQKPSVRLFKVDVSDRSGLRGSVPILD